MAVELSKVLDHIEAIRELDLDGVEPTSHVVDLVNALRADVPEPSLDREVALASGARADAGWLRRPEPGCIGRMSAELLDLTAAAAAARDPRGRARRRRSCSSSIGRAPPLTTSTRSRGSPRRRRPALPDAGGLTRPLGGRAARRQGPVLHRGRPEPVGLEDPRGLPPAVHRDGRAATDRRRRHAARQDQPGRVRDGLLERELGVRAGAQPVGSQPRARAAPPAAAPPRSPPASRRGRSAPTPAVRSASRRRSAGSSG